MKQLYGENGPNEQVFNDLIDADKIIQYNPADQMQLQIDEVQAEGNVDGSDIDEVLDF